MFSLTIDIALPKKDLPSPKAMMEAAGRGVSNLVIGHLRERNMSRPRNRHGLPKSNYYADAADSVTTEATEQSAVVTIRKEGLLLHWKGGDVRPRPGKRALAIPMDPSVAGIWPSEAGGIATGGDDEDGRYALVWPKGSDHGWIKDVETGDLMWLLVPRVRIKADSSVLPSEKAISDAAKDAVMEMFA